MSFILKLSAYTFLALMGFSAWRAGVEGWRYYFGIVLFIFCTLRILTILRQRMTRSGTQSAVPDAQADQNRCIADNTPKTDQPAKQ